MPLIDINQKNKYPCLNKSKTVKPKKPTLNQIFYLNKKSVKMCPKNKGKKCKCKKII